MAPDILTNHLHAVATEQLFRLVDDTMPGVFPAFSLCVIFRGDCLFEGTWGWVDPEEQTTPVTCTSHFDLASVTKVFVETAFLTLVSANKVALDDPLAAIIPEFAAISPRGMDGGQDPQTGEPLVQAEGYRGQIVDPSQVTFRHLLTHTSGLAPWRDVFNAVGPPPPPPTEPDSLIQAERWPRALAALCRYPFVGFPGDQVRYSDLGLMLLGEATARLHGARLDQTLRDLVLRDLELRSVTYNPLQNDLQRETIVPTEYDSRWRKRRVWGEVHDENACGVGGIAGHAGLFAQARDVAALGQAWLSYDSRLAIAPALRAQALSEQANGQFRFGLGWMLKAEVGSSAGDLYGASSYGHTGYTGTSLWVDPERQLVTAILSNRVYAGREPSGILAFRRALHDLVAQGADLFDAQDPGVHELVYGR